MIDKIRELISDLREDAEWAHANEWETPITLGDHLETAANLIESLSAELEQVKREMDAAVADMQKTPISLCEACARYHTGYPCSGGKYVDKINITIACTMFEWRGVKEDPHD